MLFNPVWGRIVDRFGLRMSMTTAVWLWTLASVSHAFAAGFRGLLVARTVLGVGEGASYPGAVSTVTQTLPQSKRMRGIGIAYSGGSLGALLTPIIITPIAVTRGWRAAFWFTGALGLLSGLRSGAWCRGDVIWRDPPTSWSQELDLDGVTPACGR